MHTLPAFSTVLGELLGNPPRYIGTYGGDANELKQSCWGYVIGTTTNAANNTGIIVVYESNGAVTQTIYNIFSGVIFNRTLLFDNGSFKNWSNWRQI